MLRSTLLMRLAAIALLLGAGAAHAQYSWIGENGVRQFSDRPPPPSTPAHKILKQPKQAAQALPAATAPRPAEPAESVAAASPQAEAARSKAPPSLAMREAAYRERVKLREESDRKDAEQAQRRAALAERCAAARDIKAQVESGIRLKNVNAEGELGVATDEERAARLAQANRALTECR